MDFEERLRHYARGFRREATPPANLPVTLLSNVGGEPRHYGRFAALPNLAMAALVLVAAIGLGFGALQLRNFNQPTHGGPVGIGSTPTPSPSPSASVSPTVTPSATPSASPALTPSPTAQPAFVPSLAAIQMVGSQRGWAVGSHGIYGTTDGTRWTRLYASSDQFIGVDFISGTTGWVVGLSGLLGTTDGGRSWQQLGEPAQPLRSVHFFSQSQGVGIAGGNPAGGLSGATVMTTTDGGRTWTSMRTPSNPQSVCFTDGSHGWLATGDGVVYRTVNGGSVWNQSLVMKDTGAGQNGYARIECAGPTGLWVDWSPRGAAAGHVPYVVYATVDGQHWRTVMAEPMTIGTQLPGVPAGPGSYPGSFSVVDASDAVFVGDTPEASTQSTMIATNGGQTLKSTGGVPQSFGTNGAAFVSTSTGWVIAETDNQQIAIEKTSDGGYHWSAQLVLPR
jgi:photosystem II stability/assembly factor-like uncharacterized protein